MNKIRLILSETLTKYAKQRSFSAILIIFLYYYYYYILLESVYRNFIVSQVIYKHQRDLGYFGNYESKCRRSVQADSIEVARVSEHRCRIQKNMA